MNSKIGVWLGGIVVALIASVLIAWIIFAKSPTANTSSQTSTLSGGQVGLGSGSTRVIGSSSATPDTNQTTPISTTASSLPVFKIAAGPVSGAVFVQTYYPTTTLARYVLQENGHVLDQALDVPGSLPRTVSNTTIPGIMNAQWGKLGAVSFMQYQDNSTTKTLAFVFPNATSSRSVTRPTEISFLPDNIRAVAVGQGGTQVAYALKTDSGSTIYISDANGNNNRKVFSVGFSELTLSWPSANTLLITTKRAAGTPGVVLKGDIATGNVTPVLFARGITAYATPSLSYLLYQVDVPGSSAPSSFAHDNTKNIDIPLSYNPIPEKCVASLATTTTVYCAVPQDYFDTTYLDNWHRSTASAKDMIVSYTLNRLPNSKIIATPGGSDGGEASDILELAASPDGKYLLFIKKGDRSLWGVRLEK